MKNIISRLSDEKNMADLNLFGSFSVYSVETCEKLKL